MSNAGCITIPDFKLYFGATVSNAVWYLPQNKRVNQWNQVKDPNINTHNHSHLIFDKHAKIIYWRKDNIFNNGSGEAGCSHVEHCNWTLI